MNRKFILVVDDEAGRISIRTALKNIRDFGILECGSFTNALEILQNYDIQMILTEVVLNDCDGIGFISQFKKHRTDIPVIFVTNHADKNVAIQALRLKVFDFIEKPFQNNDLRAVVEKAIESRGADVLFKLGHLNLNVNQIRVLEMVMKGLTNKEIAEAVNLSEQGVKYHIGNLLKRFESSDRVSLRSKILEIIGV